MVKGLRQRILAVLLDHQVHSTNEIVQRLQHTIDPSRAVRRYTLYVNNGRTVGRKRPNKSGRVVHCVRKEEMLPEQVEIPTAIRFMIVEGLRSARGDKLIDGIHEGNVDEGFWQITPPGITYSKTHAGWICKEQSRNLQNLGRFL